MKKFWLAGLAAFFLLTVSAHADIDIAAVGPITGQDAPTGEQMQRGAEAAVAAINAAGGVLGQKLHLSIRDDVCDPKQSVAIANELSGGGTAAVIGPMCSGSAIPASRVYNDAGIVMISPSATNPLLTEQGFDTVFRTCGRDDQQGDKVAEFIATHYPGKAVAIVHDKTAYGQGIAEDVQKTLHKLGIHEAMYESISRGERDYSALVSKLKEHGIDVLFYGGYHTEAGLIVRQMRDQGLKTVFIGDDDLTTSEFWAITGKAGEGALMSFQPDPRRLPEAVDAVRRIRATGFEPEGITLYTYAAVQVLAQAVQRAHATDGAKLAAVMHGGTFSTVLGPVTFDSKGDVKNPDYIIYRWSNGSYAPLKQQ
ncbi:MAG TPA: branched-chain amino acid ABC transporter substrate-binding protein [Alphaproteobacteria bacterium]|nr:branched-chain amino acid ABC transporter substrate-binding protein [Alphaproteobacteria bacterium]